MARRPKKGAGRRHGMIILIVLIGVLLLSFGAYAFAELMLSATQATAAQSQMARCRQFSDSGVEYVAALIQQRSFFARRQVWDNPDAFFSVPVERAWSQSPSGRFSIVAPRNDKAQSRVRFGLVDESSKLNLNALPQGVLQDKPARDALLKLDGMTPQIADAILDWLDEDEEPRDVGAETSYYSSLSPPYRSRNGRIESLDELLWVRGITPELLYGEDADRNGWLDPNEDDGDLSLPKDNGDGLLQAGWSAWLTVHSRETNLQGDGQPKIDLNHYLLPRLYDQLAAAFGERLARFVVGYRLEGPYHPDNNSEDDEFAKDIKRALRRAAKARARKAGIDVDALANTNAQADPSRWQRGGMNLGAGPAFHFRTLYDLFGASVQVKVDGQDRILESPWSSDPSTVAKTHPQLTAKLTIYQQEAVEGRINVNTAPREVLLGVPGMTESLADAILAARRENAPAGRDAPTPARQTTAWLFAEGLVDFRTLRGMARYITARGDVFCVNALGYFPSHGPASLVQATIDASGRHVRCVAFRDLFSVPRERVQVILKQGER